jgi:uncharacterized protein (TIGR02284 family)
MSARSAVSGAGDDGVVAEAERGEVRAQRAWDAALGRELPAGIRAVVLRQYARVKEAHTSVDRP